MKRFRRLQREIRTWPPLPLPGWTPWLRLDDELADGRWLLARLAKAPVTAEVEIGNTRTRLLGRITPHEPHEARITDSDGHVHATGADVRAVRLRLDEDNAETALRLAFDEFVYCSSLLGFQLTTGELRIGVAVGFEIPEDHLGRSLREPDKSSVHVLSLPLEALSTEDIWTMMRFAMYAAASRLRDQWERDHRYGMGGYFVDSYQLDELLAIAVLGHEEGADNWLTSVIPVFNLQRPVTERTRLWFVDDASQPFRRAEVESPKRLGERWPDIRGLDGERDDVYLLDTAFIEHIDDLGPDVELLDGCFLAADPRTEETGRMTTTHETGGRP